MTNPSEAAAQNFRIKTSLVRATLDQPSDARLWAMARRHLGLETVGDLRRSWAAEVKANPALATERIRSGFLTGTQFNTFASLPEGRELRDSLGDTAAGCELLQTFSEAYADEHMDKSFGGYARSYWRNRAAGPDLSGLECSLTKKEDGGRAL